MNKSPKQFSAKAVIHRLSQKSAVTNMPEGYLSPICQSLGKGLHRRALNAVNRYDQLLVVWNHIPVPTTGRFPDLPLNTHNRLPNPDRISGCTWQWLCAPGLQWRDRTGFAPVSLLSGAWRIRHVPMTDPQTPAPAVLNSICYILPSIGRKSNSVPAVICEKNPISQII